jgi:hypothetical protein
MAGPLGRWLDSQSEERANARRSSLIRFLISTPIALAAFLYGFYEWEGELQAKLAGGVAGSFAVFRWSQAPKRKIAKVMKEQINTAIADAMGLEFSSEVDPGWSFEFAKHYGMVPDYDKSRFEDLWHGDFAGRDFAFHEAELRAWRGSGKRRRLETVFHGSILSFDTRHEFSGTTLIRKARPVTGWLSEKMAALSQSTSEHGLPKVEIAHPDFEDRFDVFSNEAGELPRLLSQRVIAHLLELESEDPSAPLYALFHDGHFVLVAPSGNMFESGSANARDDRELIEATVNQFKFVADVAKDL